MSCYDWAALLAHRFDADLPTPESWAGAHEHLRDCPRCQAEATKIDPTLAFRGAAAWSPPADEAESIRRAVRTLRRTSRMGAAGTGRGAARLRFAAAVLFAVALALLPGAVDRGAEETPEAPSRSAGVVAAAPVGPVAPAIDGLDRPQARVYEWGAEDLSVVMVVDESLDV